MGQVDDPGLLAVFGAALGLVPPWQVVAVELDGHAGTLEIGHRQATTSFTLSDQPVSITSNLLGARTIGVKVG